MVSYLQLAHNDGTRRPARRWPRYPQLRSEDEVDKEALSRLVASISRFLDQPMTTVGHVDRRRGRRLPPVRWSVRARPALGPAGHRRRPAFCGHRATTRRRSRRISFALVAQRCLEPSSKLAAIHWARERVAIRTARSSWTTPPMRRWISCRRRCRDRRADLLLHCEPVEPVLRHHFRRHLLDLLRAGCRRRLGRPRLGPK